jgi:hypothetical protein
MANSGQLLMGLEVYFDKHRNALSGNWCVSSGPAAFCAWRVRAFPHSALSQLFLSPAQCIIERYFSGRSSQAIRRFIQPVETVAIN